MPRMYSLGTSNRSATEFLMVLKSFGIEVVADIRRFPTSRRFEHFRREHLARLLAGQGIEYAFLGAELGGYRRGGYETYMTGEEFQAGIRRLEKMAAQRTVAFICAEKSPGDCHRRHVACHLAARGWDIRHIIDIDDVRPDGGQPSLF